MNRKFRRWKRTRVKKHVESIKLSHCKRVILLLESPLSRPGQRSIINISKYLPRQEGVHNVTSFIKNVLFLYMCAINISPTMSEKNFIFINYGMGEKSENCE